MKKNTVKKYFIPAIALFVVIGVGWILQSEYKADASVSVGSEYNATTTGESSEAPSILVLPTRAGIGGLGSVIFTGQRVGWMEIYDATTTNIDLRDPDQATSSILLAHFPPSLAVGTYTFDMAVSRGLIVYMEGAQPTTTITWR